MTPEDDFEREALKYIKPNDTLHVASFWGTYDSAPVHCSYNTEKCKGGYLRRFATQDSLMLVIEENISPDK